jgi:hypothetical protein
MKEKYIVNWKPRKGGRVQFRSEVGAVSQKHALAQVRNHNHVGEFVSVVKHDPNGLDSKVMRALLEHAEQGAIRNGWRSHG